jgi:hypothetical protein
MLTMTPEMFEAAGLPRPLPEYKFHETRKWRFDFAWPYQMLAVEIEGGIWESKFIKRGRHLRGKGFMEDMEKYRTAELSGWHVLRYAPSEWLVCVGDLRDFFYRP